MSYINEFLALGLIGLLGAMSPGPDFAIVTQNSLQYGKRIGIYTAFGITLGCLIHAAYCVIGIGFIITQSVMLFTLIKYLGAAYLIYLGAKGIFSKKKETNPNVTATQQALSAHGAMRNGFLVNVLNPKASLCYLSIFTQVIDPQTPRFVQTIYGLELSIIAFFWFALLAWLLSHPITRRKLFSLQYYIEKCLSGFLILLGLKVASFSI